MVLKVVLIEENELIKCCFLILSFFLSLTNKNVGIEKIKNHTPTNIFIFLIATESNSEKSDKETKRAIKPPKNPNPHAKPDIRPLFSFSDKSGK